VAAIAGLIGAAIGGMLGIAGAYLGQVREDRRQHWQSRVDAFSAMLCAVFLVRSAVVARMESTSDHPTQHEYVDRVQAAYESLLQAYARSVLLSGGRGTTSALAQLRESTALLVEDCLGHGFFQTDNGRPSGNEEFVRLREALLEAETEMQRQLGLPVAPAH
jgi:acetyl esterase/lipase